MLKGLLLVFCMTRIEISPSTDGSVPRMRLNGSLQVRIRCATTQYVYVSKHRFRPPDKRGTWRKQKNTGFITSIES
ncbi:hypothetical protein C8Q75DRAFT_527217 [Abortiporus biennis]|nr:hypothetical protein C8Q75DRAFT_527217 [Abortiporus biennis]